MDFPEPGPFVPAVVGSAGSKSEPAETSVTMDASIIARQRTLKLGEVPSDDDPSEADKVGRNICWVNIWDTPQKIVVIYFSIKQVLYYKYFDP